MKLKTALAVKFHELSKYAEQVHRAEESRAWHAKKIKNHVFETVRKLKPLRKKDIACIMVARNETLRLPDALRHHRELGVDRFVIMDNFSDDGTREYLLEQPDVDVIAVDGSYSEARSAVYWFEKISIDYGWGRWYLLVDPDELFIYYGMRRFDLHDLADYLERREEIAFLAPLVDMYSKKPINKVEYKPGDRMIDCCRYFDGDSYMIRRGRNGGKLISGGPRQRVLSVDGDGFRHSIMKYPFYRMDRRLQRESIHQLEPCPGSDMPNGALLHFKFLSDFAERVDFAIELGEHYQGGIEYKKYADSLSNGTLTTMMYEGSERYKSSLSLIRKGLMTRIDWPDGKIGRREVAGKTDDIL